LPVSVVILALNEADVIGRCLASAAWADEILVADTGSTDATPQIIRAAGARLLRLPWEGFGTTRQKAVASASHDWIFSLDADEEVTEALRREIEAFLSQIPPPVPACRIRRRSSYLGRWIRFSGWQSDAPVRLFDRKAGTYNDRPVHESVRIPGRKQTLDGPLLHYTYPTLRSHVEKINRYSDLGAELLYTRGKRTTPAGAFLRGFLKFLKMYGLRGGFMDGREGYILARISAFGVTLKYLKLWRKSR